MSSRRKWHEVDLVCFTCQFTSLFGQTRLMKTISSSYAEREGCEVRIARGLFGFHLAF